MMKLSQKSFAKAGLRGVALLAAAWGLQVAPSMAHHSAVQFDFTKQVSYTGVVKEFAPINPHMRLVIDVKQPDGVHEVKFEGHSTNNMFRAGYRKGMVNVGDTLTVNCAPFKNGDLGGYVISAKTSKGETFGQQSRAVSAEELKKQAESK